MATRIHHLSCATMCPYSARLLSGEGGWTEKAHMVAHVLLIEAGDGLVLVDAGLGSADVADPRRTGAFFRHLVRPTYRLEDTAIEQIKALGHAPADVRHIAVTHLDVDHAGGLGDFPQAQVHIFETELEAALHPGLRERLRYIQPQWAHGPEWVRYRTEGDEWYGFESVRAIPGIDEEIVIVPLAGHTRGHSAIAVRDGDRWLLHCGDAYFHRDEIATPSHAPPGLKVFEAFVEIDRKQRLHNRDRLAELAARHGSGPGASGEIELFCAHDPVELERLAGA